MELSLIDIRIFQVISGTEVYFFVLIDWWCICNKTPNKPKTNNPVKNLKIWTQAVGRTHRSILGYAGLL